MKNLTVVIRPRPQLDEVEVPLRDAFSIVTVKDRTSTRLFTVSLYDEWALFSPAVSHFIVLSRLLLRKRQEKRLHRHCLVVGIVIAAVKLNCIH